MSEKFNPVKAWLGIGGELKPTYYELLGLPNFESEPPILSDAVDQAVAKVQPHVSGPHQKYAEKLLSDLKAIRGVLLSPEKRRAYDEQLRVKLGISAPTGGIESLAPSLEAADSPTMMLPPGALSMSAGANSLLNAPGPGGFPPTAPSGFPPASQGFTPAASPGFPMPGAPGFPQPAAPGMPGYGATPFPQAGAFPNAPPMAAPPMSAPMPFGAPPTGPMPGIPMAGAPGVSATPFGAQPAIPQAPGYMPATGFPAAAAPASPFAAPGFGAPAFPQAPDFGAQPVAAPLPTAAANPMPTSAPAAGPGFSPRQSTMRVRKASARRQQNSNIMIALGVLGAAVVILLIVIFVAKNKDDQNETAENKSQPQKTGSESDNTSAQTSSPAYVPGGDVRVPPTEESTNSNSTGGTDSSMSPSSPNSAMNPSTVASVPDFNTLVPMLAPTGATPVPSTTGTMPEPAASTPPTPGALPGVVVEHVNMAPSLPEDAERAKSIPIMFRGIRMAIRTRDYSGAEERALVALVSADTPAQVTEATEYSRVLELIGGFWKSVREGIKTLKEGDELTVNGKTAPVVRHDEVNLVVKLDGKELPLVIDKLVPGLAADLAQRVLPKDDAATKLVVGTFLAFDQPTERSRGQSLVTEAGVAGLEVAELIRILQQPE